MHRGAEPLSPLDASFLYLESPRTPMHMGFIGVFEGTPLRDGRGRLRTEVLRDGVQGRLHLVPKLRQHVSFSLAGEAAPVWVDDSHFEISNHVRQADVRTPGTEVELLERCAELMAQPLDRHRPLWEIWLLDGLEGNKVAILEKVHHAMADGLADVELATVLFDLERYPARPDGAAHPWRPKPPPSRFSIAARDLGHRGAALARALASGAGAVRHPMRAGTSAVRYAQALSTLATWQTLAPVCSVNARISEKRMVAVVRQSMAELEEVGRRFGVTLNDILLTAVAEGIGCLLAGRNETIEGRTVQVLVPVGMEHPGDRQLGNQVSAILVRLPIGPADAVQRLETVARAQARCKRHHQALAGDLLLGLLEPWPPLLLETAARLVHHQPFVNLVATNVPGPRVPLYVGGAKMLEAVPLVPIAGNLSVGVAALSYDGQLTLGLLADPKSCPDLDSFAHGLSLSFAELIAARGGRSQTCMN